jgi:hypothetical protein
MNEHADANVDVEEDLDVEVYADVGLDMDKDMGKGMDKDVEYGKWNIEHGPGKVWSSIVTFTPCSFQE